MQAAFFSLSLSPPKGETVMVQDFENAIDQAAEKLGLAGQPRVVIFHEKEARRHCHVVFGRIDTEAMKAINLPFYKSRLTELSRELYLAHGWDMPKGLADKSLANPLNFSLEEWQIAKRAKRDPREIKAVLKQCWTLSDGPTAFAAALRDKGFWLCRDDRRGFVAVDYRGNIYSLSRWLDIKPKMLKSRLSDQQSYWSVDQAQAKIADVLNRSAKRVLDELDRSHQNVMQPLLDQRRRIIERQREELRELGRKHQLERNHEIVAKNKRFRSGLMGLWDWLVGNVSKF